jgi:hypothetical protein
MSAPGRPKRELLPASGALDIARYAEGSAGAVIRLGVDPRAETSAGPLAAGRTPLPGGKARSAKGAL